ncbi:molybdate ABC transporter substrate-binding protein [Paenibacillus glucanolyticus]|jgi:molybdate transport system substrate-binding protein|uniref:molybdate ABC transporter substrate-binding protein n=1 Tax=Paenibacillus TaxID=44249 RepID=UPI0003E21FFF|nr:MULTISPECIES: molybdate ABC transporter substrate-binding protein [Paenibacillus]ANA79064.1 molybdate ABC transporter substrate-binding protein [Paenibacillus glucanolyticus]AVV57020.1 molybdate ABC transporter substrate-binding protein [Paenibacillus glucanolyticus]ETT39209.1 molybdenum ABC transporter molybdate-binding protein [Paenibacillus sp. FSL R5-808]
MSGRTIIGGKACITWVLLGVMLFLSACSSSQTPSKEASPEPTGDEKKVEVIISAAASLKASLEEAGQRFEAEHPNVTLRYNFGGSGALGQQMEQGAPVDLFVSAAAEPMERLVEKGIVKSEAVQLMFRNSLVLVVPADNKNIKQLTDLLKPDIRVLAIGQPDTVPAGEYAKETLQHEGLWEDVESKAVYAKDVTAVLAYVESGNADAGFVYKTDLKNSAKAVLALEVDPDKHQPIEYPGAVLTDAKHPKEAKELLEFMKTPEVREIFTTAGFEVVGESP